MKFSKIIFILISSFVFINAVFAQEKTTDLQNITNSSEEKIETILNDYSLLTWKEREKELPKILDKIEHVNPTDKKDLFLAQLYIIFSGQNYVDSNKATKLIENYLSKHPESHEGYLVYAKIIIKKHLLEWFRYRLKPSKQEIKENIIQRKNALSKIEKSLKIKKTAEGYQLKAKLHKGEKKIELLETSVLLDPTYNDAWRELIDELNSQHRYDEALLKIGTWMKNNQTPNLRIEILRKLARVLKDKREPKNAIQALNLALATRNETGTNGLETSYSGIDEIYLDLAHAYQDAKETQHATEYYIKYLVLNPKDSHTRFELALLYDNSGQVSKAITQYEQVLAYNKSSTASIYNLGLLYEKIDEERSKKLLIKYIRMNIDNEDEDSIKWVNNAKSELRTMGIYDYPKSKKELAALAPKPSGFGKLVFLLILIPLAWKYKKATRFFILTSMIVAIVFICITEADSSDPRLAKAFLYFIPVFCTGTFLLYIFRKPQ